MVSKIIQKGYTVFMIEVIGDMSSILIFCLPKLIHELSTLVETLTSAYVDVKRINFETKEKRHYESNGEK